MKEQTVAEIIADLQTLKKESMLEKIIQLFLAAVVGAGFGYAWAIHAYALWPLTG